MGHYEASGQWSERGGGKSCSLPRDSEWSDRRIGARMAEQRVARGDADEALSGIAHDLPLIATRPHWTARN